MAIYLFTGAAIFSVIPLLILVKIYMEKVKQDPHNFNELQKKFFIRILISKIFPTLLLVLAMTQMENIHRAQAIIPWLIILFVLIYGIYYILSFKKLPLKGAAKEAVHILATLSLPFIFSIPLIAACLLFIMTL